MCLLLPLAEQWHGVDARMVADGLAEDGAPGLQPMIVPGYLPLQAAGEAGQTMPSEIECAAAALVAVVKARKESLIPVAGHGEL